MIVLCVNFAVEDCIFDVKFAVRNCKYYTYVLVGDGYEGVEIDHNYYNQIREL